MALERGHRLRFVLPMAAGLYAEDFDKVSLADFNSLCAQAEFVFVAPPLAQESTGFSRDTRYLAAGFFIAQHAHIMFAAWNGQINGEVGGTSHIVAGRLTGIYDGLVAANDDDTAQVQLELDAHSCLSNRLVCVLPTRRISQPASDHPWSLAEGLRWMTSITDYRARWAKHDLSELTAIPALDQMVKNGRQLGSRPQGADTGLDWLQERCDDIANHEVNRLRFGFPAFLFLSLVAITAFTIFGDFSRILPHAWVFLAIYVIALALLGLLVRSKSRRLAFSDPTGWRRLTEGLRILSAWHNAGAGIGWASMRAPDPSPSGQSEDWVEAALRGLPSGYLQSEPVDEAVRDLNAVRTGWVLSQIAYFDRKGRQSRSRAAMESIGRLAFLGGLTSAMLSFTFAFDNDPLSLGETWIWFFAGLLPALGALLIGYGAVLEQTTPEADRARLRNLFDALDRQIMAYQRMQAPTQFRTLRLKASIIQVGREALRETQEWSEITAQSVAKAGDIIRN